MSGVVLVAGHVNMSKSPCLQRSPSVIGREVLGGLSRCRGDRTLYKKLCLYVESERRRRMERRRRERQRKGGV